MSMDYNMGAASNRDTRKKLVLSMMMMLMTEVQKYLVRMYQQEDSALHRWLRIRARDGFIVRAAKKALRFFLEIASATVREGTVGSTYGETGSS